MANTELDTLELKIHATATQANNAIDKLVKNLGNLAISLGTINASNFNGFANGINNVVTAMQGMKTVGTADFTRIAKGVEKISKIDTTAINKASTAMTYLGKAFNGLETTSQASEQIIKLSDGIKQLGYKSSTNAIQNIPKLATAMKQLMQELSNAPRVSQNLIDMTNALAQLSRTGASSGRAANSLRSSFSNLTTSTGSVSKSSWSLASAFGKLYASYWLVIRGARLLGKSINIASSLTEVENVVRTTFGQYESLVDDMAKTSIQDFGMSELSVKQFASTFQAMGTAMGISSSQVTKGAELINQKLSKTEDTAYTVTDSVADMSLNLTKLTADMASFYDINQSDVAKDLQAIFTGQVVPLRKYGLDLTQATLKEWALKQGLDGNIKSMSQAEKTMLRYQYVMANTANAQGDFARTADTWHNQTVILKQSFQQLAGIIGTSLINAFKPFVSGLNFVMSKVISFAETVTNALGHIFGWKFEVTNKGITDDWSDVSDSSSDVADDTGTAADNTAQAAKNIEKMNKGARQFDELKLITTPDDSGSGSGKGNKGSGTSSGAVGDGADGNLVKVDTIFKDYESEINSLYELGEYIGNALTNAMNSINWDNVYAGARNFGTGLADFLNGLISPELFGAVGRTIAGALNTAIYAALAFGERFDWSDFGLSIASGINEFFATFDFKALAQTLNVWVNGIEDMIKATIKNINWKDVFSGFGSFFSELELDTGLILAALAILPILEFLDKVEKKIGKIIELFKPITAMFAEGGLFGSGGAIASASAPVIALTAAFATLVIGLGVVYATNEDVRNGFYAAVNTIKDSLQPAIEFLSGTVLPDLDNAWHTLIDILTPFANFLKVVFTDIWQQFIIPSLEYVGKTVVPTMTNTFSNLWNNVLVPLGNFLSKVLSVAFEKLSDILTILWKNVTIPLGNAVGTVLSSAFEGMAKILNDVVISNISEVISTFQFLWNDVLSPIVNFLYDVFRPAFESVYMSIGESINGVADIFKGLIDFIYGVFSNDWSDAWTGVTEIFIGIWETLTTGLKTPINACLKMFEGMANKVIDVWNSIKSGINSLSVDIPDWLGGGTLGFDLAMSDHVSIPRFEMGGYIPQQYSLVMAGENGVPEIAGTVGGKSAVAGGAEITGIKDSIYDTSQQEIALHRQEIQLLQGILDKKVGITQNDIGNSARKYAKEYFQRTGRPAFDY